MLAIQSTDHKPQLGAPLGWLFALRSAATAHSTHEHSLSHAQEMAGWESKG